MEEVIILPFLGLMVLFMWWAGMGEDSLKDRAQQACLPNKYHSHVIRNKDVYVYCSTPSGVKVKKITPP